MPYLVKLDIYLKFNFFIKVTPAQRTVSALLFLCKNVSGCILRVAKVQAGGPGGHNKMWEL